MQIFLSQLYSRFHKGLITLALAIIIAFAIARFYPLSPPAYIPLPYQKAIAWGLVGYKVIELVVFCIVLLKLPLKRYRQEGILDRKKIKLFYFLVPQGSIVFGFLAYKLSGNVLWVVLFVTIGVCVLLVCRPAQIGKGLLSDGD